MLAEFLGSSALNWIYFISLLVSFVFALLSLFGAEFGDAVDFETESGIDAISISPFALAMFGAAFGLTGLITRVSFDMEVIPSVLISTIVGLIVGVAAQALFLYVFSPSKSSHYSLAEDAVGREVEVIVTIPADGMGTIAFDNVSGRVTLGARSTTGSEIRTGQAAVIEKITGRVAFVRPVG